MMSPEREKALEEALEKFKATTVDRRRARFVAITDDGQVDVTEDVVSIMDRITETLDWGSGFFNDEDLHAWYRLAALLKIDAPASVELPS